LVRTPPPVSLYATRWKPFLAALVFAGGIAIDLLFYFVWRTPPTAVYPWEYQEPLKTILFVVVLLVCATFVLFGLYWTLTPLPLLQLSASGMIYRPFPLPTRTISWDDVDHISASLARKATAFTPVSGVSHTILTLSFTPKPQGRPCLSAGTEPPPLEVAVNLGNLSLRADELVRLIRTYHDVQWPQQERERAQAD
jgi:hypothetical protein